MPYQLTRFDFNKEELHLAYQDDKDRYVRSFQYFTNGRDDIDHILLINPAGMHINEAGNLHQAFELSLEDIKGLKTLSPEPGSFMIKIENFMKEKIDLISCEKLCLGLKTIYSDHKLI